MDRVASSRSVQLPASATTEEEEEVEEDSYVEESQCLIIPIPEL